jgi:hypothetical protein
MIPKPNSCPIPEDEGYGEVLYIVRNNNMITVRISNDLIEQSLTTSNEIRPLRVTSGLPEGSKLISLFMSDECVELHFTDPLPGPDRQIQIELQSFPFDFYFDFKEYHA